MLNCKYTANILEQLYNDGFLGVLSHYRNFKLYDKNRLDVPEVSTLTPDVRLLQLRLSGGY